MRCIYIMGCSIRSYFGSRLFGPFTLWPFILCSYRVEDAWFSCCPVHFSEVCWSGGTDHTVQDQANDPPREVDYCFLPTVWCWGVPGELLCLWRAHCPWWHRRKTRTSRWRFYRCWTFMSIVKEQTCMCAVLESCLREYLTYIVFCLIVGWMLCAHNVRSHTMCLLCLCECNPFQFVQQSVAFTKSKHSFEEIYVQRQNDYMYTYVLEGIYVQWQNDYMYTYMS